MAPAGDYTHHLVTKFKDIGDPRNQLTALVLVPIAECPTMRQLRGMVLDEVQRRAVLLHNPSGRGGMVDTLDRLALMASPYATVALTNLWRWTVRPESSYAAKAPAEGALAWALFGQVNGRVPPGQAPAEGVIGKNQWLCCFAQPPQPFQVIDD